MRIGTVQEVTYNTVRVFFHEDGIMSGELHVLRTSEAWMPNINDRVLVIYPDGFNSEGYVLGVIQ